LPHQEYLQVIDFNINFVPPDTSMQTLDIQMPLCTPKQICNIHKVTTVHDNSSNGIRWTILLSLEPKDRFLKNSIDRTYQNDVFYKRVQWNLAMMESTQMHTADYPYPFAYPYDKLRVGLQQSSVATGSTWNVLIFYTIEPITPTQLTAITVRRGTVRHAREGGPEGT